MKKIKDAGDKRKGIIYLSSPKIFFFWFWLKLFRSSNYIWLSLRDTIWKLAELLSKTFLLHICNSQVAEGFIPFLPRIIVYIRLWPYMGLIFKTNYFFCNLIGQEVLCIIGVGMEKIHEISVMYKLFW